MLREIAAARQAGLRQGRLEIGAVWGFWEVLRPIAADKIDVQAMRDMLPDLPEEVFEGIEGAIERERQVAAGPVDDVGLGPDAFSYVPDLLPQR